MKPLIDVAALALLDPFAGDSVGLFRRKPKDFGGGLWEFPGGKVEASESLKEALVREIQEELHLNAEAAELIGNHYHEYPQVRVNLHVFVMSCPKMGAWGQLPFRLVDHDAFQWWSLKNDPVGLDIVPADLPFLAKIQDWVIEQKNLIGVSK